MGRTATSLSPLRSPLSPCLLYTSRAHQPRSIRIAALLDKPSRRKQPIEAQYIGFTIPDAYVVGYGLDYAERYRNLPDICVLENL